MSPANMIHIAEIRDERGEINEIILHTFVENIGVLFHFYQSSECLCLLCLLCFVYSIEYDILLTIKICSSRVLYSWRADQTKHIVTVRH